MWRSALLMLALPLMACGDETISGFVDPTKTFQLVELAGEPFTARATIAFPEQGRAQGEGACNRWSAAQLAPYPWIELGPIAATRRACPELEAEQRFFDALARTTLAEAVGDVLLLTTDQGETLVFEATN